SRPSPARPTSTPRCTRASPRRPARRASTRSASGSRPSPAPRRATRAASPRASRASPDPVPAAPATGRGGPPPPSRIAPARDAARRRAASRVRVWRERSMTTTYDPFHPKYFDEADLREEMTRVYDLCHGCRLCFKFCTAFPTLFEAIDRHDDQDAAKLTTAEQDQVVDECFQCKLCYI